MSNYGQEIYEEGIIEIGVTGFEPATSCSQSRRSSQAELHPDTLQLNIVYETAHFCNKIVFGISG